MTEHVAMTLSVCMITYNHEAFIKEAIQSVLNQQTSFNIELVIGEDFSTDNTRTVCEEFAANYPQIIRLLPSDKNYGAMQNVARTLNACSGKYISLLEGDDYWTDTQKLQKQVDLLEKNAAYSIIAHRGMNYYESEKKFEEEPLFKNVIEFRDFAVHKCMIHTMSVVFRNNDAVKALFSQHWVSQLSGADLLLYLFLTKDGNKAYCLNDVMGVYRIHNTGSWQGLAPIARIEKQEKDILLYTDNLQLSAGQKRTLEWQYKNAYISRLSHSLKKFPTILRRIIIIFCNRVLFIAGPGCISAYILKSWRRLFLKNS